MCRSIHHRRSPLLWLALLSTLACVTRAPGDATDGGTTATSATTAGASTGEATDGGPSEATTGTPTTSSGTVDPSGATGAATTGASVCLVSVGPHDEPPEADPDGCFAVASEPECEAKGDACVGLFGVPAECLDERWCTPERGAQVFLGCRPFTICKPNPRLVCTASDSGPRAFHTGGCTPAGFGPCEPQPALPDGTPPPC